VDGVDGSTWFNGAGAPGVLGIDGDYYLDDTNGDVYQKVAGVWTVVGNIMGPAGADGVDGVDGAPGPPGADGADGADGAPGADGADGQGVPTGGTAGQHLAKIDGTDFNTEWVDPPTGGASLARDSVSFTTASIAAGATDTGSVTIADTFLCLRINADYPFRIRLYRASVYQTADLARKYYESAVTYGDTTFSQDKGLLVEIRLPTTANMSWPLFPLAMCDSDGDGGAGKIYWTVENLDSVARAITVDIYFVALT
jgi:hypothetical protein